MEKFVDIYLPAFFDWVIETSIMASILVGLILCIKVLFRNKLTPRWQYMLWIILIIRLVLPWSPDSSYSIYSVLTYKSDDAFISSQNPVASFLTKERMQELKDIDNKKLLTKEDTYTTSSTKTGQVNKTQTHSNEDDETILFYTIFIYIWLTGVILLSVATFVMNRCLLLYIKKQPVITDEKIVRIFEKCKQSMSVQRNIPLLVSGKVSSPTVLGFIKPKLLLSTVHMKILDEQQLRYIFHHELAHIKRRDVGVNWLMHGLLILNWFNPILWYAYSCMREDQELACDALALTYIDSEEQIAYGHTIISLLEHYSSYYKVPSMANFSKNKRMLKRRILMIKKLPKKIVSLVCTRSCSSYCCIICILIKCPG
ncbi:Beta-lactamase regulatory protein 1 [Bacillus cereus 172560W]|nr:Beta-lactamase regulatory protein 1 [Bacillus cereus 172560W]